MIGKLLSALSRLTASINKSADLFDAANEHLTKCLHIDADGGVLDHEPENRLPEPRRNGKGVRG